MTRYTRDRYGRDGVMILADDLYILEKYGAEYVLDEVKNTLNVVIADTREILVAIDVNGNMAVKVPCMWHNEVYLFTELIKEIFGFRPIFKNKYGRDRIYLCRHRDMGRYEWIDEHDESFVTKYVIDDTAKVVVFDIHGVPVFGAKPQKKNKPKHDKISDW